MTVNQELLGPKKGEEEAFAIEDIVFAIQAQKGESAAQNIKGLILDFIKESQTEIEQLRAALDSIEIEHGITDNGNLWRFWSKKAAEVAAENKRLRQRLQELENGK